ncbi:hypothetical protein WA1_18685 [Scytonema hofmannii PCC 7110]|uniref:ASCH domain-containing protein n=1 Tax=Scytonema hofmannii PCC 7110 TaxID=128403 RepID=A0A139XBG5_9CYAN|nr:hypothetical protein [Scytonema hofmannii]KYC42031.1 hypothetical protein WA1_18685 [Scytonema hofmannii PCC 7110]
MIFSFSLTNKLSEQLNKPNPLLTGAKTVTRRNWSEKHAQQIVCAYQKGNGTHQAWSNMPYVKGAYRMGFVSLTSVPVFEKLANMPEEDVLAEGGLWASKQEFIEFIKMTPNDFVWVVRFKFFN